MSEQQETTRASQALVAIGIILVVMIAGWLVWRENVKSRGPADLAEPYVYDLQPHLKVDPSLIAFEEQRKIAVGYREVRRMDLRPDGTIWVAGDQGVRAFDESGAKTGEIKLHAAAYAVAVGKDGKVYVAARQHIEVFDGSGARLASWKPFGKRAYITGIAPGNNEVFVADSGNRCIWRCDPDGKVLGNLGARNPKEKTYGLVIPSPHLQARLGTDGNVYANNQGRHRIEAYTPAGELQKHWGKPAVDIDGFSGCCNPVAFALMPDGSFVTTEKGTARVKIMKADGSLDCVVVAPSSFGDLAYGVDVDVDNEGRVYVLDRGTRSIRVFVRKEAGK